MIIQTAAAVVLGFILGWIEAAILVRFVRELDRGNVAYRALAVALGLIVGSTVVSAPIGARIMDTGSLWAWYTIGEGIVLVPICPALFWRHRLL